MTRLRKLLHGWPGALVLAAVFALTLRFFPRDGDWPIRALILAGLVAVYALASREARRG